MHVLQGLVYSGIIACWLLAIVFGVHEIRSSVKNWYLPDHKTFGLKVTAFYLFSKLLWLGTGVGLIVISVVQLTLIWKAVLAL